MADSRFRFKLITVLLDVDGTASRLARILKENHGLLTGNIQNARGTGDPASKQSFLNQAEKDLLSVVVPVERADEIFELIYDESKMGDRFGGFMFQSDLASVSEYSLPQLSSD